MPNAKYRKLAPRFWRDEKVRMLSPAQKLIAIYVLTSQQTNRIGLFSFSIEMAAKETGIPEQTDGDDSGFRSDFDTVCHTVFWEWDVTSEVVFLPCWFRYNAPDNPKALIGFLTDLDDLPDTCLLDRFLDNGKSLPDKLQSVFRETAARYRRKLVSDIVPDTVCDTVCDTVSTSGTGTGAGAGAGTGTGTGTKRSIASALARKRPRASKSPPTSTSQTKKATADAEAIYQTYPKHVGHGRAVTAIRKALRAEPFDSLLEAVKRYAESVGHAKGTQDWQYVPHPATWFNGERWKDEPDPKARVNPLLEQLNEEERERKGRNDEVPSNS